MISQLENPDFAQTEGNGQSSFQNKYGDMNEYQTKQGDQVDMNELSNDYFFKTYGIIFSSLNETIASNFEEMERVIINSTD